MLNKIIDLSLRNRLVVICCTIAILMCGMWVLIKTNVDIFPDLNAPQVVIMTEAPGMAPDEVETIVTYPIETVVNGSKGVKRVRSSSSTGFSVVWVEFNWDTDEREARQTISEKLSQISGDFPQGVRNPVMGPQSSILGEMLIIGITAEGTSLGELRTIADRVLKPQIMSLGGVAQVSVLGGDVQQYQILLNPMQMRAAGVTIDDVLQATENSTLNASGGIRYQYGNEYLIKAQLNTSSLEDLSQIVVKVNDEGDPILLNQIASVQIAGQTPRLGVASVEATPAVVMTVTKQPDAPTTTLTDQILQTIEKTRATLPSDVKFSTEIFRQSDFINTSIDNLQSALLEGALMVIIVLFLFLFNLRTALISLVALPLSVIITVIILWWMGYGINTMSIGGIAIAIGSLVDDAIVDVENVYKRLRQNAALPESERQPVLKVVYQASAEVRVPIFNSTLIIIAGFLPLFFLTGLEGRLMKPLGVSFIVALLASTVVALTITPVLCSFLSSTSSKVKKQPWVARKSSEAYGRALQWSLDHWKVILWTTGGLFAVALGLFFTLGRGFLPGFNEGSFTINISALPGIDLAQSDSIGMQAERLLLQIPQVRTTARKTGRAELDEHSLGVNMSEIEVPYKLDGKITREKLASEIRKKLATIPGVNIEVGQPISHRIDAMLSGTEAPVAIKIFGDNLDELYRIGTQIKNIADGLGDLVDVSVEQQVDRPQIMIKPHRQAMALNGVSPAELSKAVNVLLEGQEVSQIYKEGFPYSLVVKASPSTELSELTVNSPYGPVALNQVAQIVSTTAPNTIQRENAQRRIVVSANIGHTDLETAMSRLQKEIEQNIALEENYRIEYGGQYESQKSATRTLVLAAIGALVLIFLLLYLDYKDWKKSLVILLNIPLAMIGGVLILVITRSELNIPAIIGLIALLGITTRNGMLLMSRYNNLQKEGVSLRERILMGSKDRFLPIIMTALTSALALIPIALRSGEPGNEIQSPLAIVILGGLVSSTALNIFVVPLFYRLISRKDEETNKVGQ